MIAVDWNAMLLGLAAGAVMGALFMAGLALGIRVALRRAQPAPLLALSALVRIAGLLGVGWVVAQQGGPWAALGYAAAFLAARTIATALARAGVPAGRAP